MHNRLGYGPAARAALVQTDELVIHRICHLDVAGRLIVVVAESEYGGDHPAVLGTIRFQSGGLDVHLSLFLSGIFHEELKIYAAVSCGRVVLRLEFKEIW